MIGCEIGGKLNPAPYLHNRRYRKLKPVRRLWMASSGSAEATLSNPLYLYGHPSVRSLPICTWRTEIVNQVSVYGTGWGEPKATKVFRPDYANNSWRG